MKFQPIQTLVFLFYPTTLACHLCSSWPFFFFFGFLFLVDTIESFGMTLGKQSRGDNKKISEYFKGHPPSSPGRQSGTKSPSPVHQQQLQPMQSQQQSFMGVPNVSPSPQGAATTTTSATAITASSAVPSTTASSYPNSNMNHSAPSGAFLSLLLHHLDHLHPQLLPTSLFWPALLIYNFCLWSFCYCPFLRLR
jgi:hypothetical protein